jgi:sporulation protein YlmC with PRC-barrel domain
MASATQHPNHQLISSEDVEGTEVYDQSGKNIGEVDHLMLDKTSGRVAYAVISFGGFLGLGHSHYPVPWGALKYDTSLGGFRTNISEQQLRDAPRSAMTRGAIAVGRCRPTDTTTRKPIGKRVRGAPGRLDLFLASKSFVRRIKFKQPLDTSWSRLIGRGRLDIRRFKQRERCNSGGTRTTRSRGYGGLVLFEPTTQEDGNPQKPSTCKIFRTFGERG